MHEPDERQTPAAELRDIQDLDTPAVVVDLDRVEENLRMGAEYAARTGATLRPHTKTHKSPFFAQRQIAHGATGICVAKVGEAEVMADAGFRDIFVPNTIVGTGKAQRLRALVERGVDLSVGVDHIEQARGLSQVMNAAAAGSGAGAPALASKPLGVMIEVDTGSHRGGVQPADAVALGRQVAALRGLEVRGVYAFEGYQYAAADHAALAEVTWEDQESLVAVGQALGTVLGIEPVISAGSTPALSGNVPTHPGITELRFGTYIFNDAAQAKVMGTTDHSAAYVLATVVARPAPDRAILDSGSKTLSMDAWAPGVCWTGGYGLVCDLSGAPYAGMMVTGLSEEHGTVKGSAVDQLQVGQKVLVLPNHICPVINLFDEMYAVRGGHVEMVLPVAARGRLQ